MKDFDFWKKSRVFLTSREVLMMATEYAVAFGPSKAGVSERSDSKETVKKFEAFV